VPHSGQISQRAGTFLEQPAALVNNFFKILCARNSSFQANWSFPSGQDGPFGLFRAVQIISMPKEQLSRLGAIAILRIRSSVTGALGWSGYL
jgi:hypothetical protein